MRIACLFLLLPLFYATNLSGQLQDDSIEMSLLTCEPGEELYSKFGHSAIRVQDRRRGSDLVFNYGIFDFDTEYFYAKFVRGKLDYMLGLQRTNNFVNIYEREGREVREVKLNLSPASEMALYQLLQTNYQPENRYYRYDFFFDNCATKIRDIMEAELELSFEKPGHPEKTFRHLLDEYVGQFPWADFGIDLILGLPTDRKASYDEEMFLPDYLEDHIVEARYSGAPLGVPTAQPLSRSLHPPYEVSRVKPLPLFIAIFVFLFLVSFSAMRTLKYLVDLVWFSGLSVAGLLLTFMWVGTEHEVCWQNLNLLWANPLALPVLISICSPFPGARTVQWAVLLLSLITIIGFPLWPQEMPLPVVPIALGTVFRLMDRLGLLIDPFQMEPKIIGPSTPAV